jgi:hypothetical protein
MAIVASALKVGVWFKRGKLFYAPKVPTGKGLRVLEITTVIYKRLKNNGIEIKNSVR